MHKKNNQKIQVAKIKKIIFHNSFHDKELSELICRNTREEVIGELKEPIEVHLVPDIEKGEVLIDSHGTGSFQHDETQFDEI